MEPRIQYAKTKDGVSIAFWTLGEGPPLVFMTTPPFSHIQLEWQWPELRQSFERLAQRRRVVRYDGRGSGLSDRDITHFSLETQLLDLEAVVDRLNLEQIALYALVDAGPAAIAYAARHPERVSHLILWATYARGGFEEEPETQGLLVLLEGDWRLFMETLLHTWFGWSAGDYAHSWAELFLQATTQEVVKAAWNASNEYDVTALLPQVRSPTLVLHPSQIPQVQLDESKRLASQILNARLTILEGLPGVVWWEESGAVMQAIDEFLGEGENAAAPEAPPAAAVHTILFTDMVESTALSPRLGDAKAREVLRIHESIVREALRAHGGAEVKTMGDGFMASFSSGTRALECAIAMQRAFAGYNAALLRQAQDERERQGEDEHTEPRAEPVEAPVEAPVEVRVRIGLNAGEPIAEDEDLFGTAVIRAARIAAMAEGGEILVANVVRELAEGKGFLFADRGETALRGFDDPVRLYEVRWQEKS